MKRITTIIVAWCCTLLMLAQSHLHVAPFFYDAFKKQSGVESVVLHSELKRYKLSLYHSITLDSNHPQAEKAEALVLKDAQQALHRESGRKGNRLYYGFYCLPSENNLNRFLFYRNNALRKNGEKQIILIYMEGTATLDELKQTFGK